MKTLAPKILGVVCVAAGLVWSVLFPKAGYFLRPDFVASVAIGLGLIIPGVIMLFVTRMRALLSTLAILFIWSVLLNVFQFSLVYGTITLIHGFTAPKSGNEKIIAASANDMAVVSTRIEITQGAKKFAAGDRITITEVSSEKGTLAVGDTITVKGTYILASRKNASLLLSVTQDASQEPLPEQGKGSVHKTINAGTGEYEMTISISQEGWLHLGFYNPEVGKPFGQLYFGTKEQMDKIANWNLDYVTSEQLGKNIVLLRYAVQADEEVAYEVNLDGKLVSTGKALIKQYCYLSLPVTLGDHILTVTAPGYATWQKTVTLLEGAKNGQNFWVELKKPTK